MGAGHHVAAMETSYSSALAIRESISLKQDIRYIKDQIPSSVYIAMEKAFGRTFPILPDDLSSLLPYKLMLEQASGYTSYLDIDPSFSDRLTNMLPSYTNHASFCEQLKTKNMTYTRVSRNLLHILLNLNQADMDAFCTEDYIYYARMLGFRKKAEPLLSLIKKHSEIPLLSKLADADGVVDHANGRKMLASDIRASNIYSLLIQQKFGGTLQNEYRNRMIIM